jgi:competence protein ComEC
MMINCISLLAGASSLELFQQLPSLMFFAASTVIAAIVSRLTHSWAPLFFAAGLIIVGFVAYGQSADQLESGLQGRPLVLNARIVEFPQWDGASLRLVVRPIYRDELPEKIRLTWSETDARPMIGEVWHLNVRLRRPRGYANPGGFDYEGWLFRQRIGATGYVIADQHNYLLRGENGARVDRFRRQIVERITALAPEDHAAAVLMAIAVGARHAISREQWELYAATGTSHLMAISGLHIGLAAGSAYLLSWAVFAPFFRRRNLRDAALATAVVAAGIYATMAGLAVPAQRAMLMALIAGVAVMMRRRIAPGRLLAVTALLVFVADPLAILAPGFRLSFAAVAILFLIARQHLRAGGIDRPQYLDTMLVHGKRLGVMQLALLAGLFPLVVLIFGRFTLVAPAVNIIVLPIFNFITVPLSLAGMVLDGPLQPAGDRLLLWAHQSIRLVLWIVAKFAEPSFLSFRSVLSGNVLITFLPALFVLLPAGWPGRRVALIAMIFVTAYRPSPPPDGCLDMHALDVGQGLAIVMQTHNYAMLYDTGPSFRSGSNAAELVVLPFLAHLGIRRLDRVVISHADLDHSGGIRSVIAKTEVGRVLVGEALPYLGTAQTQCVTGSQWQWDGMVFTVLHPRKDSPWTGNNSSCVLEIDTGNEKLLLAGDIESAVEKLLAHQSALQRSRVVFVPHHGSRTSSGAEIVNATRPDVAIVSAGHENRWGFPKEDVVRRWQQAGATVLDTATSGAISLRFCRDAPSGAVREERVRSARYWHAESPESP